MFSPGAGLRDRQFPPFVCFQATAGRIVWTVRSDERDLEKERIWLVVGLKEGRCSFAGPVRVVQVLGQLRCSSGVIVPA